ncbi:Hsp70 protein-domain-containing protein [Crepidotus variabilis]|uniref:Hsp70 protein-domain-containing protein n=1 Tax=Crepidotus variabilis TaxID=179855 RepID=A0A9P6EFA0_9AGAR|nr:Hsp70 protein-domain-containing protein [Crepidotus variabilis]
MALLVLIVGMTTMRFSSPFDAYRIMAEAPMYFSSRTQPSWDSLRPGDHVIGIDLGTENVRVALERNKTMELLPITHNSNVTPVWMQFRSNDTSFTIAKDRFHDSAQASAIELMSLLFKEIKRDAEAHFEVPIRHAVISVPTYFNDAKRQAVKDAGQIAGIQILRVANDPTLAGIGFELDKRQGERNVLVIDYGFNLDISLVLVDDGVFEILSTSGESAIGKIDSEKPARLAQPAFYQSLVYIDEVLKEANINKDQIDDFLLLGGESHNPTLLGILSEYLGKEPTSSNFPSSEAIVRGAAIQGGIISGVDSELCTCCPLEINTLTVGVETVGGVFTPMVQRNNILPVRRQMNFSTTASGHQLGAIIRVYEGERSLTTHNRLLGLLDLGPLGPSPNDDPRIQITMEISVLNDISVEAKILDSGKTATMFITEKERMSHNRESQSLNVLDATILDAESNLEIDEAIRRFFDVATSTLHDTLVESLKHGADGLAYSVDSQQVPLQEKPTRELVASVYEEALEWFKKFGLTASIEELKRKQEAIQTLIAAHGSRLGPIVGPARIQLKEL